MVIYRKKGLYFSGILLLFVLLLTACNSEESSSEASSDGEETEEIPKIHIYANTGSLGDRPEGSTEEELDIVKQHIIDEVGVEPVAMIPPKGSEEEKLNLLLGSNDKLDVFQGHWDRYKDAIIPLNDLLEEHGPAIKEAWTEENWQSVTDKDGQIWGIPRHTPTAAYPLWIRSDWLDSLNLEMPTTLDELEQVLKAFKENDPDGNGQDDTIPLLTDYEGVTMAFTGGFTEYGYGKWLDDDGKIKPAELAPGFKEFLEKMADWYQKGYIYKESFSQYDVVEQLSTNRVGTTATWYSGVTLHTPRIKESIPEMEYALVEGITGPAGVIQSATPGQSTGMLITKKAENPEAIIKLINWQYENLDNHISMQYGLKGEAWDWADEEQFNIETLDGTAYAGEFQLSLGLALETQYASNDPIMGKHAQYLNEEILDIQNSTKTGIDTEVIFNDQTLSEKVPNIGDIERLLEEETVKFIMGARPISEFDQFLDELNQAGMEQWIEAHTEIYNEQAN